MGRLTFVADLDARPEELSAFEQEHDAVDHVVQELQWRAVGREECVRLLVLLGQFVHGLGDLQCLFQREAEAGPVQCAFHRAVGQVAVLERRDEEPDIPTTPVTSQTTDTEQLNDTYVSVGVFFTQSTWNPLTGCTSVRYWCAALQLNPVSATEPWICSTSASARAREECSACWKASGWIQANAVTAMATTATSTDSSEDDDEVWGLTLVLGLGAMIPNEPNAGARLPP